MKQDSGVPLSALRVDGGAATNNALMQFQADMLGIAVHRPRITETTALGAAYLAGLAVGYWRNTQEIAQQWQCEREFAPTMDEARREHLYRRWKLAVSRALRWQEPERSSAAPAKN